MKVFKASILTCIVCAGLIFALTGCSDETKDRLDKLSGHLLSESRLSSVEDLNLEDEGGGSYSFDYGDDKFYAEFDTDTWTIYNSYRITNSKDIKIICEALSEEHPVPSKDRESYRTPADMAFEWQQHNIAYEQLPEGNQWRESAMNVDLDPDDQGKTFKEMYEERTGKKLDLDTLIEHSDKIKEKAKEKLQENNIDTDNIDFDKIERKLKEKAKEYLEDK